MNAEIPPRTPPSSEKKYGGHVTEGGVTFRPP
jgi:hypothetical protein